MRGYFFLIWKVLLCAGCLWWLTTFFDLGEVRKALNAHLLFAWCVFQIANLLSLPVLVYRLGILAGPSVPVKIRLAAILMPMGGNIFLPARTAEFIKPLVLARADTISFSSGFAATIMERISDLLALAGLCFILLLLAPPEWGGKITSFIVTVCGFVGGLLFFCRMGIPFFRHIFLVQRINSALSHVAGYHIATITKSLTCSFMCCAFGVVAFHIFVSLGNGPQLGVTGSLELFIAAVLAYSIPGLPAGVGIFEAAVVFVLSRYGMQPDAALSMAIVLHVSQITMGVIGGLFFFFTMDITVGELRSTLQTLIAGLKNVNNH